MKANFEKGKLHRSLKLNRINLLPKTAGVYVFRKDKEILYIGKATNIKERVKQHKDLLSLAKQIGFIRTNSEIEALILEANLIKKYRPKYNVVWKDDKNYFYVAITKEEFPRVFITHQPEIVRGSTSINEYVGPFVDGTALKQTLKILRKVFPYRTCKTLPKHPCLWYQLDRCPAPCLLKSSLMKQIGRNQISTIRKESQRNTKKILKILQGKKLLVLKDLKKEMKMASKYQDYEKAAKLRDQLFSLKNIMSHAKVLEQSRLGEEDKSSSLPFAAARVIEAYDVSNIQGKEAVGSMVVFTQGKPDKSQYRKFKIKMAGKPNDVAMLKEILSRRLKHIEWPLPDLMLIDGGKTQLNAALSIARNPNFPSRVGAHVKPAGEMWGKAREKLGFRIMSLAKRKNELFVEGRKKPLLLKTMPREIFNLILQLRDEAHRFAIAYHHKLRKEALLKN